MHGAPMKFSTEVVEVIEVSNNADSLALPKVLEKKPNLSQYHDCDVLHRVLFADELMLKMKQNANGGMII